MKKIILASLLVCICLAGGCVTTQSKASWPKPPRKSLDIQGLINKAQDNSTVTIPFGEYRLAKGLKIKNKKNLTLTCRPGTRILVEDTDTNVLSIHESDGVQIENLYLRHLKPLEEHECHGVVVRVKDSTDTKIVNCELNGCGAIGVVGYDSNALLIRNCFVHHNTFNAFYFEDCGEVKIQSSVVEDNGNFIQMYQTESLEMRDNVLRRNGGYWKSFHDPNPGLKEAPSNRWIHDVMRKRCSKLNMVIWSTNESNRIL